MIIFLWIFIKKALFYTLTFDEYEFKEKINPDIDCLGLHLNTPISQRFSPDNAAVPGRSKNHFY